MNNNTPASSAETQIILQWSDALAKLAKEFPNGIANKIVPDARRNILLDLANDKALSLGAERGAVFCALLRIAMATPGRFTERYLPLEKLNAGARLEFGNGGVQPFRRERAVKK